MYMTTLARFNCAASEGDIYVGTRYTHKYLCTVVIDAYAYRKIKRYVTCHTDIVQRFQKLKESD
jgi:hypothetical protein